MASGSNDDEGNTEDVCWSLIGSASELSKKRCRLMYSSLGHDSDVCLFFVNGEFFAMDARCAHAGKSTWNSRLINNVFDAPTVWPRAHVDELNIITLHTIEH